MATGEAIFVVSAGYEELLRRAGLDAHTVFTHPGIRVWRDLPDRQNCTYDWDGEAPAEPFRLHIKRYTTPAADVEVRGIRLLQDAGIPTVPLVAHGRHVDGRSFIIVADLTGFGPADRLIAGGVAFDLLLAPTAELAAKLHDAGLHHRDLYLCHFFARMDPRPTELRLIDAARVRRLPRWPFRRRWIVKDLAQFWYSAMELNIPLEARRAWLDHYAHERGLASTARLQRAIESKAASIARHDARLRAAQPDRNISIPK